MDEVIVRIWDHDEYQRRADDGLHLGRFTSWHAPILPAHGDFIVMDGAERQIMAIKKRVFEEKFGKLVIDILVHCRPER